jgi:hypothetical protein
MRGVRPPQTTVQGAGPSLEGGHEGRITTVPLPATGLILPILKMIGFSAMFFRLRPP